MVFALLGPPLGELVLLLVMFAIFDGTVISPIGMPFMLPAAYFNGIVPALLVGLFDDAAARRRWPAGSRALFSAATDFLAAFVPLLLAIALGFLHGPWLALFGVVGAVPAAICSLVASLWSRAEHPIA